MRRISSGSAGASSAYSANFVAVTPCVCHAYVDEWMRPYATSNTVQARNSAIASQSHRPRASGAKPSRKPLHAATTTTASTAKSDRYALTVVEPKPTPNPG